MADRCGFKECDEEAIVHGIVSGYIDGDRPVFECENGMPKNKLNGMLIPFRLPLCEEHLAVMKGAGAEDGD
jgi:hypothetical protein